MNYQYVLGVDHGSGGCKVTCLRSDGRVVSDAYIDYPSLYPNPRWVEQDPESWIGAANQAISKVLHVLSSDEKKQVKAIGFSAPHHVAVLLDKKHGVIRPAIMWNDQRADQQSRELAAKFGSKIYELTYNTPNPTWTLCHLLWLKQNEPAQFERINKIVFMKDYVRYRFSGELGTDHIDAEGSLLYDVEKQEWSTFLLSLIELEGSVLPNIYSPTDQCGLIDREMAESLGLEKDTKIIVGSADTAAEVYGCGTLEEGDGVVKLATAGNFTIVTSNLEKNKKLTTYHHLVENLYYQNSATNFAAASFRWFKENFYSDFQERSGNASIYPEIMKEVEKIKPGSEGLIFQPYLNGERSPHWDPHLRASFFGCTARHTRSHFARAVLEGVGYSLRDCSLQFPNSFTTKMRIIGGGSKGQEWIQIIADILNRELEIPAYNDASFGVALVTATGIGWFANLKEAVTSAQSVVNRVSPSINNHEVYSEMFEIYQQLHKHTYELSHRLAGM